MTAAENTNSKLGYEDYVLLPSDGLRHEIIDGEHYMNPAPSTYHQTVSKRLQHQLYTKIELAGFGLVFYAPCDVELGEHDIVQPDLVVVSSRSSARVTPSHIIGAPELLVEILSPSTACNDLQLKREAYQRSGVLEYWIVDPSETSLLQLVLQDGQYVEQPHGDKVRLVSLPQIEIERSRVW